MSLDSLIDKTSLPKELRELIDYVHELFGWGLGSSDRLIRFIVHGIPFYEKIDGEKKTIENIAGEKFGIKLSLDKPFVDQKLF